MATTPGLSEALANGVVDIYARAELLILEKMARLVAAGLSAPEWMADQLLDVRRYRAAAEAVLAQTALASEAEMISAIEAAVQYGDASAVAELGDLIEVPETTALQVATQNVAALAAETSGRVTGTHFQILSRTESAYRRIVGEVINAPILGVETRQQAASRALQSFAREGITVYTQSNGRKYGITAYTEMATRSALMNATLQGHANRLQKNDIDLVVVSNHAQECKLCRPFEGKVLSLSGDVTGRIEVPGARGGTVSVDVHSSMRRARAAGLFHPNCRHTYAAYVPGVTRDFGETADPQGDADRQKLRRLEREKRSLLKAEAVLKGLDSKADLAAVRSRIRTKNAQIKHHTETTTAKRQRDRERISGNFA